jgi:hypothetical protein
MHRGSPWSSKCSRVISQRRQIPLASKRWPPADRSNAIIARSFVCPAPPLLSFGETLSDSRHN